MEDIEFLDSTTKSTKRQRKITFNEKPEYFTIMPTNSKDSYNDNDERNDSSTLTLNMDHTQESKMDKNSNFIDSLEQQNNALNLNQTLSEDLDEKRNTDDELEEEDDDAALEIISDKVVLLMMDTGGVADKYTPAVRNMQEGKMLLKLMSRGKYFILYYVRDELEIE